MAESVARVVKVLEAGRLDEAAERFAPLAGPEADGVIARFRRAECLSRLGRHGEAEEEARRAAADAPDRPAAPLWLAQTLAEAGKFEEAAAVRIPRDSEGEIEGVAAGFAALVPLAADDRSDPAATVTKILDSRHSPVYSLALRVAERARLDRDERWPDLPSVFHLHDAFAELDDQGKPARPDLPPPKNRKQAGAPDRWVRLLELCGDWATLDETLRKTLPGTPDPVAVAFERSLSLGLLDEAEAALDKWVADAGKNGSGELAVDLARLAHLRGGSDRPESFKGFKDARRSMAPTVAWLDLCAALADGRDLDARRFADSLADPSHREFVETALLRWTIPAA